MKHLLSIAFSLFLFCSFAQTQPPSDLEGAALRSWLKDNWYTGKFNDQGYNQARIQMYGNIDVKEDDRVYGVYSGFSQPSESTTFLDPINAEHTVPQSIAAGSSPQRSDIIHLFPTHGNVNSARGSKPFREIPDNQTETWYASDQSGLISTSSIPSSNIDAYSEVTSSAFEPSEDHKGDLARAVFYFFTVYSNAAITEVAEIDLLYQWHKQDPVSDWEITRNNRIEGVQGNRNPYVDYPDIVCKAWGLECPSVNVAPEDALIITGVMDGPLPGGLPKTVELFVASDITDLTTYGISSANNGGGATGSPEFSFTGSATAGDFIYLGTEETEFANWFGFTPDFTTDAINVNGDDAIELFYNGSVIDLFGDPATDGSGEAWEYLDGWAYRVSDTGPDGNTFVVSSWSFSGADALDSETSNATATSPFPIGTYTRSAAAAPSILISTENFQNSFGAINYGTTSESSVYMVSGSDLSGDVTITAPDGFNISFDDETFSSSLSITPQDGTFTEVTVYVRFEPLTDQAYMGVISHQSEGAITRNLSVSGTGLNPNTIFLEDFSNCMDLNSFTTQSVVGPQEWGCSDFGETGEGVRVNGFAGGNVANEDWLISPEIDLSGVNQGTLTFQSSARFEGDPLELFIATDFTGDVLAASWNSMPATLILTLVRMIPGPIPGIST